MTAEGRSIPFKGTTAKDPIGFSLGNCYRAKSGNKLKNTYVNKVENEQAEYVLENHKFVYLKLILKILTTFIAYWLSVLETQLTIMI